MSRPQDWASALKGVDKDCPYVGPRPQTLDRDGREALIGRDRDIERIVQAVVDKPLVVLHGYSGVGKSSLLLSGILAHLRDSEFPVLFSRKWLAGPKGPSGGESKPMEIKSSEIEHYIAGCISETHDELFGDTLDALSRSGGLSKTLDEFATSSDAVMLVLDQFEELLRQDADLAESVVKWVINLAYRPGVRVVISLRTDSLHLLDPLLRGVRPFSLDRIFVGDITNPDSIEEIMKTPRRADGTKGSGAAASEGRSHSSPMSAKAVDRLLLAWKRYAPKLLDLQAALYALYFRADEARGGKGGAPLIQENDIKKFEEDSKKEARKNKDSFKKEEGNSRRRLKKADSPFSYGLREAIRLKISHAIRASHEFGLDQFLISGAREVIRRAAPIMSSGDFKVPVNEIAFTRQTLARELRVLEPALRRRSARSKVEWASHFETSIEDIFDGLGKNFLTADRKTLVKTVFGRVAETSDELAVAAGPLMALPAEEVLVEEIRRVRFAIDWLVGTELARREADGTLLLVHDASGKALKDWADKAAAGFEDHPFYQLTAARGEHYEWGDRWTEVDEWGSRWREPVLSKDQWVFVNLNWRECRVSATTFRKIVFVDCDFSRVQFDGCVFEGVTFVNCRLDGATFSRCTIKGRVNLKKIKRGPGDGRRRPAPSFLVEAPDKLIRAFASYRTNGRPASGPKNPLAFSTFFSDTSGLPAVPGGVPTRYTIARFIGGRRPSSRTTGPLELAPARGGVAMVASRLCNLLLYHCEAEEQGALAFHYVSGSGLDIVEQRAGMIEIYGGAIRGISVTRDEGTYRNAATKPHSIEVAINDSNISHVFFSGDLKGSAKLSNSCVFNLLNASKDRDFPVTISNSRYQFVANARPSKNSPEVSRMAPADRYFVSRAGHDSVFDFLSDENREKLADDARAMDFSEHPELQEKAQRDAREKEDAKREARRLDPPRARRKA